MPPPRFTGSQISGTYLFSKKGRRKNSGISFYPQAAPVHQMPPQACFIVLLEGALKTGRFISASLCLPLCGTFDLREKNSGVLFFHLLSYKKGRRKKFGISGYPERQMPGQGPAWLISASCADFSLDPQVHNPSTSLIDRVHAFSDDDAILWRFVFADNVAKYISDYGDSLPGLYPIGNLREYLK